MEVGRLLNMKAGKERLEEILKREPDELVATVVRRIRPLLESHGHSLILFGTGQLGRIASENLQRMGKPPVAFADNNPALHGSEVNGIPVLHPEEAQRKFPDSLFCVTVYTNAPILAQLEGMGAERITFAELAWVYPAEFLPRAGLELPHKIFAQADQVRETFSLWEDKASRQEYLGQIAWRTTLDSALLPAHSPVGDTYFPPEIFALDAEEVFVDCGAFDGDSIRAFLHRSGDAFRGAVGLEPDPITRERFESWRKSLPEARGSKIQLLPYATGEKNETLTFDSTGTAASAIGSGQIQVECRKLDDTVAKFEPTFIKMDIEGAEPSAVRGAANILRTRQPILAVCLYHAQEHLWEIPLLIQKLNPDYELFLRRSSDECWEIVCYAIPKSRRRPRADS